jgi:iron complex transport system ATP-binding protein
VYGVDCDIVPHPRTGHPVIVFSGPDDPHRPNEGTA